MLPGKNIKKLMLPKLKCLTFVIYSIGNLSKSIKNYVKEKKDCVLDIGGGTLVGNPWSIKILEASKCK